MFRWLSRLLARADAASTTAADRELEERAARRTAWGDAYSAKGHQVRADAVAGVRPRPPLTASEARQAVADCAAAPTKSDGELVAIAIAAIDMSDQELARLLAEPHRPLTAADVARLASRPGDAPLAYWTAFAGILRRRAPVYDACAAELDARVQAHQMRLGAAALGRARDVLTPSQVDLALQHYVRACIEPGAPIEVALATRPVSELEEVGRAVGEAILRAVTRGA
jgi:hypothetical protein